MSRESIGVNVALTLVNLAIAAGSGSPFTGCGIKRKALGGVGSPAAADGWMPAGAALPAVVPLTFGRHEMRFGRTLSSPSLAAGVREYRAGEWLVGLKADIVVLREDVRGRGPAYVFADADMETPLTEATTLTQALAEQTKETD